MKLYKKARFIFILITFSSLRFLSLPVFAITAICQAKGYEISLVYNKELQSGDPIFILAQYNFSSNFLSNTNIPSIPKCIEGKGELIDKESQKQIRMGNLFAVKTPNSKICTVACMIPTSAYLEPKDYDLKVTYTINGKKESSFILPITCNYKDFIQEDIPLDAKNTGIKQDSSSTRMAQIKKLNTVLGTADFDSYKKSTFSSFSEPLVCNRRTSFFGDRRKFIYTDGKSSTGLHYGIDYGVKTGTDVHACSKGKVVLAENRISTGYSICIEHMPGLYSLYYHLDSMAVKTGEKVKEGQFIGKSGCTGLATGPHLHWEIRLNMEAVNPDWFVQYFTKTFLQETETFLHQ
ncbi:MAG: M23 family metallopeptidase [Treponemataceae bacterium]|nr:M23 family metallopeptidase [Spirochaetales bacterium]MDY6031975.1 M23 family metallopeptidase [Treponemataceae bacterium]